MAELHSFDSKAMKDLSPGDQNEEKSLGSSVISNVNSWLILAREVVSLTKFPDDARKNVIWKLLSRNGSCI
jgi:hypothetical protein